VSQVFVEFELLVGVGFSLLGEREGRFAQLKMKNLKLRSAAV
jgi:uncharacterized membrane protein